METENGVVCIINEEVRKKANIKVKILTV